MAKLNAAFRKMNHRIWQRFILGLVAMLLVNVWISPAAAIDTPVANPNLTPDRITIGLREELGKNTAEIERILRANPRVRIGWPSEYEIGADPDWPDNFYLIDMGNPGASSVSRRFDAVPQYDEPARAEPVFIGRLDDGSFALDIEEALRKIVRRKTLVKIRTPSYLMKTYECLAYANDYACPGSSNSQTFDTDTPLSLEIHNAYEKPQYVYMLEIGPDNEIRWILWTAENNPIAPRETVSIDFSQRPFVFDRVGRYDVLTITTERPMDSALFMSGEPGKIDPDQCVSILERVLCEAITGRFDPTLPKYVWDFDSTWHASGATYYGKSIPVAYVGGGAIAAAGFAPWQVEIFSNLPYTKAQIEADRRLPKNKSKFLWKLTKYQQEHRCGGSLIAHNIVLTAAHCVAKGQFASGNRVLNDRRVRVGTQNLASGGSIYAINSVVVHPGYRPGQPPHDIALLRINPIGRKVPQKPILLPDAAPGFRPVKADDLIHVLGWGYTGVVEGGQRPELSEGQPQAYVSDLRIGNLTAMDLTACRKINKYAEVNSKSICAETPDRSQASTASGNTFSCRGDSGGPVIRQIGRTKVQVGLVSWGIGCGAKVERNKQNPSVFVDVSQYTGWIKTAKSRFVSGRVIRK